MGFNFGSLGSSIGGLADFATSAWSKNEDQKHADTQAWVARNYQAGREDTAYQRTVADLNAAGLSPMLAYARGPLATGSSPVAGGGQAASSDFSGSVKRDTERDLIKEQTQVAESQKQINIQSAKKVAEEVKLAAMKVLQEPARFYYEQALAGSQINSNSAAAVASTASARNTNATAALTEEGKAPSSDPTITRTIKDAWKYGVSMPNQFFNDMVGNVYKFGKSYMKGRK